MANNNRIIECVPNFSEGRDMQKINSIVEAVKSVKGVMLLNVDPGEATNRTVVTFVGDPEAVCEAAFRAVAQAARVIDMRLHHGAHPRIGATDVLPLVPVSGVTLEECAQMARQLAERIARELRIPCYSYEAAAFKAERRNLAVCRKGEYEALADRVGNPDEAPDYGARPWDEDMAKSGATVVGARDFLIAVNFNLNTTSTRRANAIAFDVREKGRPQREGGKLTGKILKDANGKTLMQPGTLKYTKAIGWFIDEYGIAQVSMNITNINETPLHKAFDEVCRAAAARGLRVTGTEIVGLIPKRVLIEAGIHYLEMQQRSVGVPEEDLVKMAVKSMSLDDLRPFDPRKKVIEYLLEDAAPTKRLADMTVKGFVEETSRESPAPGGGTIAATMGALGAALGAMVANLSAHKRGWDDRWQEFSVMAERGQKLMGQLMHLIDEDTDAFNQIMAAFGLPKATEEEKAARTAAIQRATLHAAEVPLETVRRSFEVFDLCRAMAQEGNPASVSDAGVGALAARAAVRGAALNVKINAASLADKVAAKALVEQAQSYEEKAEKLEKEIMTIVDSKIGA